MGLDDLFVGFNEGTPDQLDAVGHCRENPLKGFPDGFWLTGHIDDQ